MMPSRFPADDSLSDTAAYWCARLHSDDCSEAERREFRRWHDADPAHAEEYAAMCRIWQLSAQLPASTPTPAPAPRQLRRRRGRQLMARAAVAILAIGSLWTLSWSAGLVPGSIRYYAAQPERRQVTLPDDSQVELNRRTALFYLGYTDRRSVSLTDGEAYFDVQRNVHRPFVIRTDNNEVRVTGTHFNIWTEPQRTAVTVTQGSVLVSPLPSNAIANQATQLTPGMQAVFAPGRAMQLSQVDTTGITAWRNGKLMLQDISLRDALPLINRYLTLPLQLADDEAAELRIGGIYDTAKIEHLVTALPRILPVTLQRQGDVILLSSR
ncbi:FecR protein [compost metagenome]